MKNKLFKFGVIGLCLTILIITSAGCGSGQTYQQDSSQEHETNQGNEIIGENQERNSNGNEDKGTDSENKKISYDIIINKDIQGEVQSKEGFSSLPEEVREWVKDRYQTETKDAKEVDGSTYILIALGESSSSGYGVEVEEVFETENTLHVQAKYTDPKEDEVNLMVITYPVFLIKVEGIYSDVQIEVVD